MVGGVIAAYVLVRSKRGALNQQRPY